MLRFLLLFGIGIILVMTLLSSTAIALGQFTYSSPPLSEELDERPDCELPCWNNLTPGEIHMAPARMITTRAGYQFQPLAERSPRSLNFAAQDASRCDIRLDSEDALVTDITLYDCPSGKLGDVLLILGEPVGVRASTSVLVFREGAVTVTIRAWGCTQRLSQHMPVTSIEIREPMSDSDLQWRLVPWQGFATNRYYFRQQQGASLLRC